MSPRTRNHQATRPNRSVPAVASESVNRKGMALNGPAIVEPIVEIDEPIGDRARVRGPDGEAGHARQRADERERPAVVAVTAGPSTKLSALVALMARRRSGDAVESVDASRRSVPGADGCRHERGPRRVGVEAAQPDDSSTERSASEGGPDRRIGRIAVDGHQVETGGENPERPGPRRRDHDRRCSQGSDREVIDPITVEVADARHRGTELRRRVGARRGRECSPRQSLRCSSHSTRPGP